MEDILLAFKKSAKFNFFKGFREGQNKIAQTLENLRIHMLEL